MAKLFSRLAPFVALGATLAIFSVGAVPASGLDQKCESASAAGYPLNATEISATEACFNAFDIGQSTELNALTDLSQQCSNEPASAMQSVGGGFQKSSASGIKDSQTTAKAKVKYFTAEKAIYKRHRQTVVADQLANVVSRLGDENTAVIAVWTDFANVATALSGDDCDAVASGVNTATTDWSNENSANSDLAKALGAVTGHHEG